MIQKGTVLFCTVFIKCPDLLPDTFFVGFNSEKTVQNRTVPFCIIFPKRFGITYRKKL